MRFALTKDHLDFFYRNHYIEFEDLLTLEDVLSLEEAVEEVLTKRMGKSRDPKKVYLAGSHCWQDDPRITKAALSLRLAEIVSQLTKERTLRLASSQILSGNLSEEKVFNEPMPIETLCSVQRVSCGVILHLSSSEELDDPQPKKPGSATFFSTRLPISFDYLTKTSQLTQLFFIYSVENALYTLTPTDPHTHALKKLGYGFGDHVRPDTHPIVITP